MTPPAWLVESLLTLTDAGRALLDATAGMDPARICH